MFSLSRGPAEEAQELATSRLYDQDKFYDAFLDDLRRARTLVVIESPFITMRRLNTLLPALQCLSKQGITIVVNTKPLDEHDQVLQDQAARSIESLQEIGVRVLMTVGHHRKLAIIDSGVLWEGSLNILSQNDSCEFMRRIQSPLLAVQTMRFIGADRWT